MPFLKFDASAFEDLPEEMKGPGSEPSEDFEYSPAEATFEASELGAGSLVALEALKAMGVTQIEVSYDGGYDEGFAYPERVFIGGVAKDIEAIAGEAGMRALVEQTRKSAKSGQREWLKGESDAGVVKYVLDDLASELASKLLGEGFGTGEYELYGSFRADLKSGVILDNPKAKKRSGGLGG